MEEYNIFNNINSLGVSIVRVKGCEGRACLKNSVSLIDKKLDIYCFALNLSGKINVNLNAEDREIKGGDLFIATPDTHKKIKQEYSTEESLESILVIFSSNFPIKLDFNDDFLANSQSYFTTEFNPIWSIGHKKMKSLKEIVEKMEEYLNFPDDYLFKKEIIKSLFKVFFYEVANLAKTYAGKSISRPSRKKQLFLNFYILLKNNFKIQRSLNFYAEQLFVTPKYLSEVVKETTGNTASVMIDDFVMEEAKYLLKSSSLTIAQISESLNFSDQSFFGKYFKRNRGISPKKYREENELSLVS